VVLRLCGTCGKSYDPQAGYHRGGKCQDCTRDYERERARTEPSRRLRNSTRFIKLRREIKARDGNRCVRCGAGGRLDVHHIVPISKGGEPYNPGNLATLCVECHGKTWRRPIAQPQQRFSRRALR
jgi:5-methylcytosine-specific restriction enzyme A